MSSKVQSDLLEDLRHPNSYGTPLVGWKEIAEFYRAPGAPPQLNALNNSLSATFVEKVYFLLRTTRPVVVYRGCETTGLQAPFGKDHPGFVLGLLQSRRPGTEGGLWWTPARPSLAIDNLRLAAMHRAEVRSSPAIKLEWNRLDYYLEGELPVGSLVYVGRAAPQQESLVYGGTRYPGGGIQFRLTTPPQQALLRLKRYEAR